MTIKLQRQQILGGALVATLAATAWVATRPDDEAAATVAAAPARKAQTAAPLPAASAASVSGRAPWAEAPADQLAAWQPPAPPPPPPAPPPAPPAPPPPPVAPQPPYQMIGRLVEGDAEVALLTGPSRSLSARRGDVIDGQWRVEKVSGSGVNLVWLPGQIPQNIVFKAIP